MPIEIEEINIKDNTNQGSAARISGIDLRYPLDIEDINVIKIAFKKYVILVFPNQDLSGEQQLEFASQFGNAGRCGNISNVDKNGKIIDPQSMEALYIRGNQLWHLDMSCLPRPPVIAMLNARELPPKGGDTQFVDLRTVWDALADDVRQKIEYATAEHSLAKLRQRLNAPEVQEGDSKAYSSPSRHPLVCSHWNSDRKHLYISAHTSRIIDFPEETSLEILNKLESISTENQFVYTHHWSLHDFVMWDNHCVYHHVLPYEDDSYRRTLSRTEVYLDIIPKMKNL